MSVKNLYDNKVYYKLFIDNIPYYISEPVNWDKVITTNERDPDFLGAIYEFIDVDLSVGFADDNPAYKLIKDVIDTKGQDGDIGFEFGILNGEIEERQFYGNVNLNGYVDQNRVITASIEKVSFESLFRTRFETPITLTDTKTLDGAIMTPAVSKTVKLHSKKINKLFKAEILEPISTTTAPVPIARFLSVQMDTSNEVASEIEGNQGLPLGISGIGMIDDARYFFKIPEAGHYKLSIKAKFVLIIQRIPYIFPIGNYSVVPNLKIQRAGIVITDIFYNEYLQSGDADGTKVLNFNLDINYESDLQIDDNIYFDINGLMEFAGEPYNYTVQDYTSTITIAAQTTALPTTCQMYSVFDAITKMLEAATGRQDALISSFLKTGCAALYYITNGYQIRNFNVADKPVIENLKRALTAISGIEALAVGITSIAGLDFLVIEPLEYFYQNKEIIQIFSLKINENGTSRDEYEYREENAKEFVFNEYEVGYNKYSEEELNTLDEFNTYQNGLFPIKSYKGKFSKKVDWVTGGYSIEKSRREQFKANPSESISNDDDIFLISCIEVDGELEAERNQNFTNIQNLLSPETSYNLRLRPKRILYNWSKYLNIMLWAKGAGDIIKSTFVKNNGALSLEMINDCQRYGPNGVTVESGDIDVVQYKGGNRTRLHLPVNAYFKSPLTYIDALTIKKALIAQDNVINSYGYIVHPDDKGNFWKSYVYSFKYNLATEVAEFKVAKIEKY